MELGVGEVLDGRYRVTGTLGEGGMAKVYAVDDLKTGVPRALKLLNSVMARSAPLRERFETEGSTMARLDHPNIVPVFEVGRAAQVYLVLERLDVSLEQVLRRRGPLSADEASAIMVPVLRALDYAHGSGVVHRDVKPANILLTDGGVPKVADFGIARIRDSSRTASKAVLGSLSFMAPEQRQSSRGVDGRSDVFSAGCTLFKLLTCEDPQCLLTEIRDEALAKVPEPLRAAVARATRFRPEDRYQSASDMAQALSLGSGATFTLEPGPAPAPEALGAPRLAVVGVLLLGVLLAVGLGLGALSWPSAGPVDEPLKEDALVVALAGQPRFVGLRPIETVGVESELGSAIDMRIAGRLQGVDLLTQLALGPDEDGQDAGVDHVIEGTVGRLGDRLMLNLNRVDGEWTGASSYREAESVDDLAPLLDDMLIELLVDSSDGAGPDVVQRVVQERSGEVKYCYEVALKRDPKLSGRLDVEWTIQRSGRVTAVKVFEDTVGDPELSACLVERVQGWLFPADRANGEVIFPFVLVPG